MGFSNFYLTDQGATLLAKLQAKKADIAFTKAAIGKGDVPAGTNIVTLAALVDQVKTLPIAGLDVASQQAQIKIQMTNADVSVDFKWKEIGVFATDPDEGEILYIYGNAGEDADTIPAYSSGLNEFLFTIIAKIANGTSAKASFDKGLIYITQGERGVSGGVANQDDFTTHAANNSMHCCWLACKKVGTVYQLTGTLSQGYNNCVFISNMGEGYVAGDTFSVNGVPYKAITSGDGDSDHDSAIYMPTGLFKEGCLQHVTLDAVNHLMVFPKLKYTANEVGASNPAINLNPNFSINQRGQSSYTNGNKYSVDRWLNFGYSTTITIRNPGITISCTYNSNTWLMKQSISEEVGELKGKVITASMVYRNLNLDGNNLCVALTTDVGDIQTKTITAGGPSSGTVILTGVVPTNATIIAIGLIKYGTGTTFSIDIDYFKLELGSVATPLSPRPYAEELAMCQRYYEVLGYASGFGLGDGNANVVMYFPFKVKKYQTPTVSLTTNITSLLQWISNVQVTPNSISLNAVSTDGIIVIAWGNASLNAPYTPTRQIAAVDSEIY